MIAESTIELPEPNTITRPYRGLSVQEVDIPLTQAANRGPAEPPRDLPADRDT